MRRMTRLKVLIACRATRATIAAGFALCVHDAALAAGDLYLCKDNVITDRPSDYAECVNNRTKEPYVKVARPSPARQAPSAPGTVLRSQFGLEWPLTVDRGTIACEQVGHARSATFTAPDGVRYALNGTASNRARDIYPIWRDNPDIPGAKMDISPLIRAALKLCN